MKNGIETIRIDTKELDTGLYENKINRILARIIQYSEYFTPYKRFLNSFTENNLCEGHHKELVANVKGRDSQIIYSNHSYSMRVYDSEICNICAQFETDEENQKHSKHTLVCRELV